MRPTSLISLFSNRNYAVFTVGNVLSMIGNWIQIVTMTWLTWEMTGSTLWLGIISAAQIIPVFVLSPWAGVLADRVERRDLIFRSQAVACVISLALWGLYELGLLNVGMIFVIKALLAGCVAINQPARLALLPDLVHKKDFAGAIAFGAVTFNVARFLGPAIAGLIIAVGDIGLAFLLNAVSFLALLVAVRMLRLEKQIIGRTSQRQSSSHDLKNGIRYAFQHAGIATIMAMYLLQALAIGPVIQLLAAYADVAFSSGPEGLAILTSASGFGSIVGGLWMTRYSSTTSLITIVTASALVAMIAVLAFVSVGSLAVGAVVICLYSSMTVLFRVGSQTLVQLSVTESMRGRVLGLWSMLNRGGPSLGAVLMGIITQQFGLTTPFYISSAIFLAALLLMAHHRAAISRALATQEQPSTPGEPTAAAR